MSAVPKLRFPEFDGEWSRSRIDEIGTLKSGVGFPEKEQGGFEGTPFYKVSDMNTPENSQEMVLANHYVTEEQVKRLKYKPIASDSIIFAKVGAAIFLDRKRQARNFLLDNNMMAFLPSSEIDFRFIYQVFLQINFAKFAQVGALPSYNASDIGIIKTHIPSLPEQQKIASFLSSVDKKIDLLRQKKNALELYKKGLMQKIFSQEIRFKQDDGSDFPDWEEVALGDVLHEHKEKSAGQEPVFSVSVSKGLVNQIEHLGRSFSAADTGHYNKAKPHDVIYTKSPTGNFPLGIIKQSTVDFDVIVSPLYGVFTPETAALGFILSVYFESEINVGNYLSPLVQKGAKNTIACTNTRFLEGKLQLPRSHTEQIKIAGVLAVIQKKIGVTSSQIEQMEAFKKGLLQQMYV